ncbi:MAG: anaerobic ribonucleoside-triphosphate reductase, partial [Candidatus Syntropharchaeia archaeon]
FGLEPGEIPPEMCPIHEWVRVNGKQCTQTHGGTARCPICGGYMCPECHNHNVEIISRVTGYLQAVSGWNLAKQQEFEDRKRYNVR